MDPGRPARAIAGAVVMRQRGAAGTEEAHLGAEDVAQFRRRHFGVWRSDRRQFDRRWRAAEGEQEGAGDLRFRRGTSLALDALSHEGGLLEGEGAVWASDSYISEARWNAFRASSFEPIWSVISPTRRVAAARSARRPSCHYRFRRGLSPGVYKGPRAAQLRVPA